MVLLGQIFCAYKAFKINSIVPPFGKPFVTVHLMKTGITPQLVIASHRQEGETGPLRHAGRLHGRRLGNPARCVSGASTSPRRSSYFRQSASPPRFGCQSCPCAIAHRDGSLARPCCSWALRRRLARRSTMPGGASESPGTSLRSWPRHTGSPLPTAARPRDEGASYRSETSSGPTCPHAPDATT